MSNKDNGKENPFWTIVACTIAWVLSMPTGIILYDLFFKQEEKTADIVNILVPVQIISSDNSESLHQWDPNHPPPTMEETEEWEMVAEEPVEVEETEEDSVEAQKEAERLANWKANFPYKPTTDPDVVVTEEMFEKGHGYTPIFRNHGYMRHFFENETRFTAQFEQPYRILEEQGRGDNPMEACTIFECLRMYHEDRQKDPEEIARSAYDHRENIHSNVRQTCRGC